MSVENQQKLVRLLSQKTAKKEITWSYGASGGIFQANIGKNWVLIEEEERRGGPAGIRISLVNSEADVVDSFTDIDLSRESGSWYDFMQALYNSARRAVSGADAVLEQIIDDLEDEIPF